jgi:hypothetical protein
MTLDALRRGLTNERLERVGCGGNRGRHEEMQREKLEYRRWRIGDGEMRNEEMRPWMVYECPKAFALESLWRSEGTGMSALVLSGEVCSFERRKE